MAAELNRAQELYVDVVLPLAQSCFTYKVGDALLGVIEPGRCVEASLGKRKILMGVVWRLHNERPPYKTIKTIDRLVPDSPVISLEQRTFWEWIASYYMCTLGEVLRAALPSAFKPEGFTSNEFNLSGYHPRTVRMVALNPSINSEQGLSESFDKLKRAKRQYEALISFVEAAGRSGPFGAKIVRTKIDCDSVSLAKLSDKEILLVTDEVVEQDEIPPLPEQLPELTFSQNEAMESICGQFTIKDTVLLYGVTGSGKTEIYIRIIADILARGEDVLYLLPEIALTAQLIRRMEHYFGSRVITYHSRYSERQRTENYIKASKSGGGRLIMGVRSAIFMPLHKLGLIVVDEEHESSFKQADPAPRYNARDSAIVLASIYKAKTLLGSATPSIESYTNAMEGKYGLVTLSQRYGGAILPRVIISDTITATKRGERRVHFNKVLLDRIADALSCDRQVILFQNRRGFSPYVECPECGWVASCPHCNVTLTLHRSEDNLKCHYCGHSVRLPDLCPACSKAQLATRGFGTEKVEDELTKLFPEARIARLDRDTAQSQRNFNSIISEFENGQTDILVGTQMITKGFDFEKVSLVGVLNADNLLTYPDFRASERAFQLMTQVAGRAGRRERQGEVVIQTSQPENQIIKQAAAGDYQAMVRSQLSERKQFNYPPYCRIVSLTLRHRDKALLWRAANVIGTKGRTLFAGRLLGPEPPPVDKVKNEHIVTFLLKVERTASVSSAKNLFAQLVKSALERDEFRYITVVWNVDPV